MGHGQVPGPANEPPRTIVPDEGTLARTESPAPGPIGLDAKGGGSSKQGQASIADQVVSYARRRLRERVGDGECFTLVDRALRGAGARSARDYGSVTPDADYVWGATVALADLRPGDIIQFRDYRYDREVVRETRDGERVDEDFQERPHHTAIVERIDGNGAVTVLEQNAPEGSPVGRSQLFLSNSRTEERGVTTTIRIQGTFWLYRPEPGS